MDIEELHRHVDAAADAVAAQHTGRLNCSRGCHACCVDGLNVWEVEADLIRRHHGELLRHGTPHPVGACAFLDEAGTCRVYAQRPYVCRTQGLPLRWLDDLDDGTVADMRDICPLNEEGEPIEQLAPSACWNIGPTEEALARLQHQDARGELRRVPLRSLFEQAAAPIPD
jgi:hypothetical protein